MIIQCTNCKAKFKVADAKIKKDETKVRCAKCGQIFVSKVGQNAFPDSPSAIKEIEQVSDTQPVNTQSPPPGKKQESIAGQDESLSAEALFEPGDLSFDEDSKTKVPSEGESPLSKEKEAPAEEKSLEDLMNEPLGEEPQDIPAQDITEQKANEEVSESPISKEKSKEEEDVKDEREDKPKKEVNRAFAQTMVIAQREGRDKKVLFGIYPSAILLSLVIGFLVAGLKFPFKDIALLKAQVPGMFKAGVTLTKANARLVKTVEGNKIFVIEGTIYNNSSKQKKDLKLKTELFAKGNRFIVKETFPCCLSISKLALHEISNIKNIKESLKKEGMSEIAPYSYLPFTLVYSEPDEPVRSYRINVLNE